MLGTGKIPHREKSAWENSSLGKIRLGKFLTRKNPLGKIPHWEKSAWENSSLGKIRLGKFLTGKNPLGKIPHWVGKIRLGKFLQSCALLKANFILRKVAEWICVIWTCINGNVDVRQWGPNFNSFLCYS